MATFEADVSAIALQNRAFLGKVEHAAPSKFTLPPDEGACPAVVAPYKRGATPPGASMRSGSAIRGWGRRPGRGSLEGDAGFRGRSGG